MWAINGLTVHSQVKRGYATQDRQRLLRKVQLVKLEIETKDGPKGLGLKNNFQFQRDLGWKQFWLLFKRFKCTKGGYKAFKRQIII